jgi:hypothetical protein
MQACGCHVFAEVAGRDVEAARIQLGEELGSD